MLSALGLALTLLVAPASAGAQPPLGKDPPLGKEKGEDIRRLLVMTGSTQLGAQIVDQLAASLKQAMPNVPERFWISFRKEASIDELLDLLVPVYDRQLSLGEVQELIRFYETPTGKKFVAVLPAITEESMRVGQTWSRSLTERLVDKLKGEAAVAREAAKRSARPRGKSAR